MIFDLLLLGILGMMAAWGAWRGCVVSASGLLGLLAGYAGAVGAAAIGSGWVARTLVVSPLIAPAIAGTLGFVAAWLVVSSLAGVLVAWDRRRVEESGRGPTDRSLGALFGLARGGLVVLLLALLASWIDAGRDLGAITGLEALPDPETSALVEASGDVVAAAVGGALAGSGPAGEVASRLAARPAASLASARDLLEDERFGALFSDELFWTAVQNEAIDYAMNRRSVRAIVLDPDMRGRFADLGLVVEEAREEPDVFRDSIARVLEEVAPKISRLRNDPEMRALARDPEILALLEAGDPWRLIAHPRIRRLVERVSADR
ncbi:MAG: CvpA family protein [bacterium]